MITGFNPADMYAVDHIRRVLNMFPGVFTGIGEFTIHKEFVSSKISGETASLTNPALDRILEFAADAGLVVHPSQRHRHAVCEAEYRAGLSGADEAAARRVIRRPRIIWAHMGLGRIVHPVQVSAGSAGARRRTSEIVEAMLADPALSHVSFDMSWDEVAKYAVATPDTVARVTAMLNRYPDRFLFGTDTVAPAGPAPYFAVYDMWAPVWKGLTPEASVKIRKGNYERIFDQARSRVRAWERAHVN